MRAQELWVLKKALHFLLQIFKSQLTEVAWWPSGGREIPNWEERIVEEFLLTYPRPSAREVEAHVSNHSEGRYMISILYNAWKKSKRKVTSHIRCCPGALLLRRWNLKRQYHWAAAKLLWCRLDRRPSWTFVGTNTDLYLWNLRFYCVHDKKPKTY